MSLLKDKIELDVEMAELRTQQELGKFPVLLRWILVASILLLIPGYLVAKGVSHGVWSARYKQYAITAKPSFTNPKDPKISDITVTTTGNGIYAAAIKVTNQNVDLSLPSAPYQFSFKNAKGEQVYQESGTLFLLPNQSKFVVVPRFNSADKVTAAGFNFTAQLQWQKRISIPNVDIQTSKPDTYNQFQPPAFVTEGAYYNNSPYQISQVRLAFLILDSNKNIIGISQRTDSTIAPYERRSYKQLWPNVFASTGSTVEVFADTNPLDPSNLTMPTPSSGSASDLSRPANKQQ